MKIKNVNKIETTWSVKIWGDSSMRPVYGRGDSVDEYFTRGTYGC